VILSDDPGGVSATQCELLFSECELEATQCGLGASQCELFFSECGVGATQCGLEATQCEPFFSECELEGCQCALGACQCELGATQWSLGACQWKLEGYQWSLGACQCELEATQYAPHGGESSQMPRAKFQAITFASAAAHNLVSHCCYEALLALKAVRHLGRRRKSPERRHSCRRQATRGRDRKTENSITVSRGPANVNTWNLAL
jgi:hypothetical protein